MHTHRSGGAGPKIVHRKALREALAQELPNNTIRFSSKLNSIEVQKQEGYSIALLHMEDGTAIKTKVIEINISLGHLKAHECIVGGKISARW
ncbi:unnamed protein product [Ilex paraguariensis]|uniref:Uncharacterized protein n=1 Tax=Ilex paraguariensis TaxID=185542 RepID=A0ABC8TBN0_9AQUA